MESPLQAEQLLAADGCQGERVSFPQECGSWVTVQAPVNGPTPVHIEATLNGLCRVFFFFPFMGMLSWEGKAVEV